MVEILELFEYSLGFLSVLTVECRTLAVLTISTGPPAQEQYNFALTSFFFSFYLELYWIKINFGPVNSNFHFEDCSRPIRKTICVRACMFVINSSICRYEMLTTTVFLPTLPSYQGCSNKNMYFIVFFTNLDSRMQMSMTA